MSVASDWCSDSGPDYDPNVYGRWYVNREDDTM